MQQKKQRQIILFGSSGQIGRAFKRLALSDHRIKVKIVPIFWSELVDNNILNSQKSLLDFILKKSSSRNSIDFIFANGIINPQEDPKRIMFSNFEFPKKVIQATQHLLGTRYLTIGSIFENFEHTSTNNIYIRSKLELSRWMMNISKKPGNDKRFLHVRLHTLYGDKPKPFMFLGQIAHSLKMQSDFCMTSGDQLREYHHVDDISGSFLNILCKDWNFSPIVQVNSGEPVRLADLANAIFEFYGKTNLLKIGTLPSPKGENINNIFPRSESWLLPYFRNPITGATESLRNFCNLD